jgi:antitoxin component of MazEF toxin-antitoxin module
MLKYKWIYNLEKFTKMLVRQIKKIGTGLFVSIPPDVLRVLDWEMGDYLKIEVIGQNALLITRLKTEEIKQLLEKYPVPKRRKFPDTIRPKFVKYDPTKEIQQ